MVSGVAVIGYGTLLSMCFWDNSRAELSPSWRKLGVGPIGFMDELFMR